MIEIAYLRRRARVRGWFAGLDASEPVPAPAPTLSEAIARVTQMRLDADDAARFLARRDPQRAVRWTAGDLHWGRIAGFDAAGRCVTYWERVQSGPQSWWEPRCRGADGEMWRCGCCHRDCIWCSELRRVEQVLQQRLGGSWAAGVEVE